jgi:hypothetical protein
MAEGAAVELSVKVNGDYSASVSSAGLRLWSVAGDPLRSSICVHDVVRVVEACPPAPAIRWTEGETSASFRSLLQRGGQLPCTIRASDLRSLCRVLLTEALPRATPAQS